MFHNKNIDEVLNELSSSFNGLDDSQAQKRLEEHGENKLKSKKKKSLFSLFVSGLKDPLIYILLFAAGISVLTGEVSDAIIILLVIILNSTISVIQESKAEQALDALQKLSTPKALVKRNGEVVEISSENIVPGDIVIIDAGRYIPADIRIIESANLKIDESALTGESVPSDKMSDTILNDSVALGDLDNMAFMSTLATYGRGVGVVTSTGMSTEIGKIANLLNNETENSTPLQKDIKKLSKALGVIAVLISIAVFLLGVFQGHELKETLLISISLAVAAIPEGLPAIVTIVLAIGMQRLVKQKAIIRKLPAVETLGSVNVICSDKTGTLTQNKMTVREYYTNNESHDISDFNTNDNTNNLLLNAMTLCNDSDISESGNIGDPTEIALIEVANNIGLNYKDIRNKFKRIDEVPFDSDRKLMSTLNEYDNKNYIFTKGAADNLLKICTTYMSNGEILKLDEKARLNILKVSEGFSEKALRVLGYAFKEKDDADFETNLTFIGLTAMIDPPREEVKDSIRLAKNAGIRTVMITGDHKITAIAIAKELGIFDEKSIALTGAELELLTERQLREKIDFVNVFARVSPEHKVRIVKAIQEKGNIVSMTGDGVNDAPSLKAADIGVAMGITGTDVSKGAADMVLLDDKFTTIISAIEEGRNIFRNIKKSIIFLLSCNIGEVFTIFIAQLIGFSSPLAAIHILWINLITDSLPALALGVDPNEKDVMNENPRDPKESIFKHGGYHVLIGTGILIGSITLIAFVAGAKISNPNADLRNLTGTDLMMAQTMSFLVLSGSQLVHSLNMRNFKKSIFKLGLFTNTKLLLAILFGAILQLSIVFITPLAKIFGVMNLMNSTAWILVICLTLSPLVVFEIVKLFIKEKK